MKIAADAHIRPGDSKIFLPLRTGGHAVISVNGKDVSLEFMEGDFSKEGLTLIEVDNSFYQAVWGFPHVKKDRSTNVRKRIASKARQILENPRVPAATAF